MMWFDLTYTAILVPMTVGFGFRAFNLSRGALSNFLLTIDSLAGSQAPPPSLPSTLPSIP